MNISLPKHVAIAAGVACALLLVASLVLMPGEGAADESSDLGTLLLVCFFVRRINGDRSPDRLPVPRERRSVILMAIGQEIR